MFRLLHWDGMDGKSKGEKVTQWALIEAPDENDSGEVFTHILPISPVDGWKTKKEAEDFLAHMEKLGNPVITDDDNTVIGTYIGHKLSKDCPCGPTPRESDAYLLVHHQAN